MRPGRVLRMLERLDAFRLPERLPLFLNLCEADERGRMIEPREEKIAGMRSYLTAAHAAAMTVRGAHVLAHWPDRSPGPWVAEIMVQWRVKAIAQLGRTA
jgi:tRNA nucleotidyltransferase (CCA-adding enzyme)